MARFDVYAFSKEIPYLVDIQATLLSDLNTRVVLPLIAFKSKHEIMPKLKPEIIINDEKFILVTTDISTVHRTELGKPVANLESQRQIIIDALDFLMQGF